MLYLSQKLTRNMITAYNNNIVQEKEILCTVLPVLSRKDLAIFFNFILAILQSLRKMPTL